MRKWIHEDATEAQQLSRFMSQIKQNTRARLYLLYQFDSVFGEVYLRIELLDIRFWMNRLLFQVTKIIER